MRPVFWALGALTLLAPTLAAGQDLSVRAGYGAPPAAEQLLAKIAEPTVMTIAADADPLERARLLCGRLTPTYLDLLNQANPGRALAPSTSEQQIVLPACFVMRPAATLTRLAEERLSDFAERVIGASGPRTLAHLQEDNAGVAVEATGKESGLKVRFSTEPVVYSLRGEAAADPNAAALALARAIGKQAALEPEAAATTRIDELSPSNGLFERKAVSCPTSLSATPDADWPFNTEAVLAALERNRQIRVALNMTLAKPVVVAVADNGVDQIGGANFPAAVFQDNDGEIPGNLKDDEPNGYVDDVVGVSLFQEGAAPGPAPLGAILQPEHGTLMASLALGGPDFRAKAPASADRVRLLIINMVERRKESVNLVNQERWLYPNKGLFEAIRFARKRGAAVLNLSVATSQLVTDFEEQARLDDQLVIVVAAGNRATQYRDVSLYPASYGGETSRIPGRFITVGASNRRGCLADFSGRGAKTVDILAPGVEISAYGLGGMRETLDGTSQATALVTFVVAVLKSEGLKSPQVIRDRLFATADQRPDLAPYVASSGVLDIVRAVNVLSDIVRRSGETRDSYMRLDQDIRLQDVCADADFNAAGRVLRIERFAGNPLLRVTWRKENGLRETFDCQAPDEAQTFSFSSLTGTGTLKLSDVALLIPR